MFHVEQVYSPSSFGFFLGEAQLDHIPLPIIQTGEYNYTGGGMKRFLLAVPLLALFLVSCNDTDTFGNPAGEQDFPVEIVNDAPGSDGQIVSGTKTQEGLDMRDDVDGDLISDENDNCPTVSNPYQEDTDDNGIGDACQD